MWLGCLGIGSVFAILLYRIFNKASKQCYDRPGSGQMFDFIASYYDLMNRIISLGLDMSWRRTAVKYFDTLPENSQVLDIAAGTGDLTYALMERRADLKVTAVDPSIEMLKIAKKKLAKYDSRVSFLKGVAEELPFEDGAFAGAMVAFGVRNFENRRKGLVEIARVLSSAPFARLLIVELSYPEGDYWLAWVAKQFIEWVVPLVGGLFTGSFKTYRYLQQSMKTFPNSLKFQQLLEDCGWRVSEHKVLTWGLGPHLYWLVKRQ
eukprot:jgi/Galph1/3563/GphlegSOOS_G2239.1